MTWAIIEVCPLIVTNNIHSVVRSILSNIRTCPSVRISLRSGISRRKYLQET